jgi:hypothetical protein
MRTVRRFVAYVLTASALLGVAAGAAFGATPTVIDPSTGASAWSYSDSADASPTREGGYREFNFEGGGYAADGSAYLSGSGSVDQSGYVGRGPHGGYDTSTSKCKVCHAVHRAEGSYYLLRASSQDDACIYCHGPGSTGSSTPVYTEGPEGIHAENGHTIGASATIPASSVGMEVEEIELIEGRPDTVVTVRSYQSENKRLYRLVGSGYGAAGHPSTGAAGAYARVGPTPLSCSSCHHVHGASAQIWRPTAYDSTYETDENGFLVSGYKLLRRFPGATAVGDPAPGTPIDPADLAKAPESRLVPDFNFSTQASLEATYTEGGQTFRQPDWVIQQISGGAEGSATVVNQFTLSVWCADCHNLAIGGGSHGSNEETVSADPHTDSTHPIPGPAVAGSSAGGGAQCYTCHRGDLARGTGCSQCHYTAANYRVDAPSSDFPHSGSDDSVKLLGAFSIEVSPDAQRWSDFTFVDATVTDTNLDAVCLRCHAVKHADYGSGLSDHDVPSQYGVCAECHGSNSAEIHDATPQGCNACHAAATLTFDCATCHFPTFADHPVDPAVHVVPAPYDTECGTCHDLNAADIHAAAPDGCFECHGAAPLTTNCSACHFDTFEDHPVDPAAHTATVGTSVITGFMGGTGGWSVPSGWPGAWPVSQSYSQRCNQCHTMDLMAEHAKPSSSSAAQGCIACHPTPVSTLAGGWTGGCQQGGCHPTIHTRTTMATAHAFGDAEWNLGCSGCHTRREPGYAWSWVSDYGQVHDFLIHAYFGQPDLDGCSWCHTPAVVPARGVSCSTGSCHGPAWLNRHDVLWISPIPVD